MNDQTHFVSLLQPVFEMYFHAPQTAIEEYARHCEWVKYKKDEVLKAQHSTERYFYFIIKGSVGVFLWKENNFVCLDFAFDRHFCSDYMSMLTGSPTALQVMTLEPSEMLRMSAENYHAITQHEDGKNIRLAAAEMSYIGKQSQQINLLTKSAGERYDLLLKQFPDIQNRIAQNHIASYLGITPQSLSRIRRQRN